MKLPHLSKNLEWYSMERPKCSMVNCNNLAMQHRKREDGTMIYRKLCTTHHCRKYKMPVGSQEKRRGLSGFRDIERSKCVICGWDKAECDRHRIVFGADGGLYVEGNVISVCPNCHRLIHRGLLKLTKD
jgi:hypothetical protein